MNTTSKLLVAALLLLNACAAGPVSIKGTEPTAPIAPFIAAPKADSTVQAPREMPERTSRVASHSDSDCRRCRR